MNTPLRTLERALQRALVRDANRSEVNRSEVKGREMFGSPFACIVTYVTREAQNGCMR